MSDVLRYYTVHSYVDEEGREVDELTCVQDSTKRFACVIYLPSPVGIQRMRLVNKNAINIADAILQYDKFVGDFEQDVLAKMNKPKIEIAQSIPTPSLIV